MPAQKQQQPLSARIVGSQPFPTAHAAIADITAAEPLLPNPLTADNEL